MGSLRIRRGSYPGPGWCQRTRRRRGMEVWLRAVSRSGASLRRRLMYPIHISGRRSIAGWRRTLSGRDPIGGRSDDGWADLRRPAVPMWLPEPRLSVLQARGAPAGGRTPPTDRGGVPADAFRCPPPSICSANAKQADTSTLKLASFALCQKPRASSYAVSMASRRTIQKSILPSQGVRLTPRRSINSRTRSSSMPCQTDNRG